MDLDVMLRTMTFWFEHIINDWMLPGQVENWVFIVNMKGMGISNLAVHVSSCIDKIINQFIVSEEIIRISPGKLQMPITLTICVKYSCSGLYPMASCQEVFG